MWIITDRLPEGSGYQEISFVILVHSNPQLDSYLTPKKSIRMSSDYDRFDSDSS